jgi:hypothetical protein
MATDRRRKLNQLLRFPDGGLNDCRVIELTDVLAIASTSRPPETTSLPQPPAQLRYTSALDSQLAHGASL